MALPVQPVRRYPSVFMTTAVPTHDRPLAAPGLISYRYKGRYGWVMIGAISADDALQQARRSISEPPRMENLQVWNGQRYEPVIVEEGETEPAL